MDSTDRTLLNIIQGEFPLTERPFATIGEKVGISEKEAIERIRRLKEEGYVRRIGLVLERKALDYESLLCGVRVEMERIDEIAREIGKEPGITHSYEREGELNLWFTVTMKGIDDIDRFLSGLENTYSLKIHRFPEKKRFKIKTYFPV